MVQIEISTVILTIFDCYRGLNGDNNTYNNFQLILIESFHLNFFRIIKSFYVTKGSEFSTSPTKLEADLTADMLARFVLKFNPG